MKWLAIITTTFALILAALYALLFTGPGNRLIAPLIEKKINRALALETSLQDFTLRPGSFSLNLLLSPSNHLAAKGDFALFSQTLAATYRLVCDDLNGLAPLTKTPLFGKFHTEGTVSGKLNHLLINGTSDLAEGQTTYSVTLIDYKPAAIAARISDIKAAKILLTIGKKPFSDGNISLNMNLADTDPQALVGEVVLTIDKGVVDTTLMQDEFGLTLPETSYSLTATAHLAGKVIRYTTTLESNLAYLTSAGTMAPESLQTDLEYQLDAKELGLFKPLTNAPLRGPLKTSGTVKGDRRQMVITGSSNLAGSETTYDLTLEDLKPSRVLAKVQGARLAKLLYLLEQPAYAEGRLDIDLTLNDLNPENLQGTAEIKISKGEMATALFKKEYDITLPQTSFTGSLKANLLGTKISYLGSFDANLAKISSEGSFFPKTMGMDLSYRLDFAKLEMLQPLTGIALRGPLKLNGKAKGDQVMLAIEGTSDLAGSDTTFKVSLGEFKADTITAVIKNMQLGQTLTMLGQPHYLDGVMNAEINIANASPGELKGNITTEISQGLLDTKVLAHEFEIGRMPETTFQAATRSELAGDLIDTSINISSPLATLKTNRCRYDLKTAAFASDYQAEIPDLDRLFFITERHLKGDLSVNGELKKGEQLELSAHSDILGGTMDTTIHDDMIHSEFKNLQTMAALKMLLYPEIFTSSLNGALDYNLKGEEGTFAAKISEGKFADNIMFDLLRELAKTDLYKELFTGSLQSKINGDLISTDFELRSRNSAISSKGAILDSQKREVDAKIEVLANNNPLGVTLTGNVDRPQVKLDAKELIKKEATKALQKEVNKLFKKLF